MEEQSIRFCCRSRIQCGSQSGSMNFFQGLFIYYRNCYRQPRINMSILSGGIHSTGWSLACSVNYFYCLLLSSSMFLLYFCYLYSLRFYCIKKLKKVKAQYNCLLESISELRGVTCHMGSYSVTCHPTQVNAPRHNPSQPGQYLIYLPRKDGRLSRPRLIAARPGIEPTTSLIASLTP